MLNLSLSFLSFFMLHCIAYKLVEIYLFHQLITKFYCSNANQNMQSHYMDLELTRINSESQPYATIANPGALAYEKIPESKSHYMELNENGAGDERHPSSSKDYEVLQK